MKEELVWFLGWCKPPTVRSASPTTYPSRPEEAQIRAAAPLQHIHSYKPTQTHEKHETFATEEPRALRLSVTREQKEKRDTSRGSWIYARTPRSESRDVTEQHAGSTATAAAAECP